MTATDAPLRRARNVTFTLLAGLLVAVISVYLVLGSFSARRVARSEEGWRESLGSMEQILERFPPAGASDTALELERLTPALGIDIAPRGYEDRPRPEKGGAADFKRLKREFAGYLERQLELSARGLEPPPKPLPQFLATHGADLARIRRLLLERPGPTWELQVEQLHAAPIPNLIGHADLQKLLVIDAVSHIAQGDHAAAGSTLEAAWRLNRSLLDRPGLITQLAAISNARKILGALRLLDEPSPSWAEYLREHDYRESFLVALKFEGWLWSRIRDTRKIGDVSTLLDTMAWGVAKPYVQFCFAELGDVYRKRLENLAAVEALCDYDLRRREANLDLDVARWNLIGKVFVPQLGASLNRLARFELDRELTEKLLQLRWARTEQRRWPDALAGIERSQVCPEDRWIYEVAPDGSMSIALDRDIAWRGLRGTKLPTRFAAAR